MSITPIDTLKFNLQEKQYPYFDDTDLQILLDKHNQDINAASYEGCMLKAQDDSIKLNNLSLPSQQDYWLRLAQQYAQDNYKTSMQRTDEPTKSNRGYVF